MKYNDLQLIWGIYFNADTHRQHIIVLIFELVRSIHLFKNTILLIPQNIFKEQQFTKGDFEVAWRLAVLYILEK